MATERAIRLLNDQAIQYLAKEKYNDAGEVLRSCLEQFLPRRMVPVLDERGDVVFPVQQPHHQPGDASSSSTSSFLHPLPTAIMSPPNDSTCNLFRECFMLWIEDRAAEAIPANINEDLLETALSEKSALLCGTVLLFNLGLVHHLRGLTTKTQASLPPGDIEQAEKWYKLALASSLELTNSQAGVVALDGSACWLLVLAIANNMGCIACEASKHETVQECLSLGLRAMKHINLPLFWSNQFTWCSPSAAA